MPPIHTITLNPVIDLIYEVDEFEKGTTFRAREYRLVPAGKGINVANALATLGEETHAYVPVGWKDCDLFADICREKGIHFHACPGRFHTRRHCTILETRTGTVTHVQTPGQPAPMEAIDESIQDLTHQIQPGDWVVLSGSVPPGAPANIYAEIIQRCRKRGARIALDASGEPLQWGAEAGPDLLKANQAEAEELTGVTADTVEAAHEAARILFRRFHIPLIALSMGKRGLLAGANDEWLHLYVPLQAEEVRDTVGCGDAMLAGLVHGLNLGFEEEAVFRYGIACASAAALRIGPACFEWADMERMLTGVEVTELK